MYSDGEGTPETIIRAGQETGLDYLIITDHNTLRAREKGYEGWHGNVLAAVVEEVSYSREHCLALGVPVRINGRQPTAQIVKDIETQGGICIVVHPHGAYRRFFRTRSYPWRTWEAPFTGIELWSYMWDWIKDVGYRNFLWRYTFPDGNIHGPHPETLRTWDALTQQRRVVAIGGLDVHARQRLGGLLVVFPYAHAFKTLLTHIVTPAPFCGETRADLGLLYQAIRSGHCYMSYEPLHPGEGVLVQASNNAGETAIMGDALRFTPPVDLKVSLPVDVEGSLVRNGAVFERFTGRTYGMTLSEPGIYRLEARIDDRPWLYTNPVYIRP